jgi:hypothetical protein
MSLLEPGALELPLGPLLEDFARDGYARLGRLAAPGALEQLRARSDDLMLGRVSYPGVFFQIDTESGRYEDLTYGLGWQGPGLNYRKMEKLEVDPIFRAWIENPAFERVVRALIEGPVVLYRATLFNKRAEGGTVLPFHQDGGALWGLDRDPHVQLWTALDDAPEEAGALEVVPGTHRLGLASPLGGLVQREHVVRERADERAIPVPARAGEVLLLHNYLWHRSGTNRTAFPRRGLTVCYMSAATRCMRKRRAPRVFVPLFEGPAAR